MAKTLTWTDAVVRTGFTEINGIKVMRHTASVRVDDPLNMTVSSVKLNKKMYRDNRDICRADAAEFEDAAYELQEQYINGLDKED